MFKSGYIAILGAPNVGKSTLLNTILKEKISIVTDKPQTTRAQQKGIYSTPTVQMVFIDTPGIHQSDKKLNQYMIGQIHEGIKDADLLCYLVSLDQTISQELKTVFQSNQKQFPDKKAFVVVNKIDLPAKEQKISLKQLIHEFSGRPFLTVSAMNGAGVEALLQTLEDNLQEGPLFYPEDQLTDLNLRKLASEIIREKVMDLTFQEIPYSVAVEVVTFKEDPEITRIEANLIVEQDSQKGMVIGKKGGMIKEIGTRARQDLEKLIGTKVFLDLQVKVDKNWTKNPAKLARYGYPLIASKE